MLVFLLLTAWEPVSTKYGYTVERRPLADVDFYEVRVRAHCRCTPQQAFEVVWDTPSYPKFVQYSKSVRILKDTGKERLVYQQHALPIIKNRDYTVRSWYERDEASGLIQIWWEAANQLGPPEDPDFVRIKRTSGSWTFEPAPGGAELTYVVASEAGGAVPSWMVRQAQVDAAPDFVRTIIERVSKQR